MKTINKRLAIPLVALTLGSCENSTQDFKKCKDYENFSAIASSEDGEKIVAIYDSIYDSSGINNWVMAFASSENKPFLEPINRAKKGSLLEKYSHPDSLGNIYQDIKETGCECPKYEPKKPVNRGRR